MKRITFQGAEYDVPAWARWVAQDGDGTITAYENCPVRSTVGDFWMENFGLFKEIARVSAPMVLEEIK